MRALFLIFLSSVLMFSKVLDDNKISCDEIKAYKDEIFSNLDIDFLNTQIDFNCENSLLNLDFLNKLFDISKEIRGDRLNCKGVMYNAKQKEFKFLLLKAGVAPEIYAKTLNDESGKIADDNRAYFRFWAYNSIGNFELFNNFWKEYNANMSNLVSFYKKRGIDEGSAIFYATKVMNDFLNFSVGDFSYTIMEKVPDITDFEKRISNPNFDLYALQETLFKDKYSQSELSNALNIALLHEKSIDFLEELIKMGAKINEGSESSLFFALRNINNIKFLLKNGADINYKNTFGKTPIFYTVGFNDLNTTKFLVQNGADINATYISKNEKFAINSNIGMVTLPFYQNLCDLEHTSRTLFMHAAQHSNVEMLKFLMQSGADINAVDDLGYNALDYAKLGKKSENIKFLENLK
ncbi:ankyrin repeat-containing periplasmic protein [Campylobacter sputorum subsp. bubulus]|uniref:Ankyrin repeat-containing periplasmic protein n=1 Tax=Campylobacter sputorum subsp. sputorum TaxID=32024 RepID=A0A381DI22_9BACT|nr:ankyrin repeat domain-containing protein [Campylobacter sputorum]ASM35306.1 ankyrin domain protein [Campylobacter sputorum aubsp. sputorum RM3237]KAB0582950.1 ankyrin repeat domain-containing protein [Campylobacter sputorum subsp. sputorum]QEL05497.1 ankyrin domain-containing protein [Campylobacter sputorum subsp. sputorum]SUX08684.1 ankyrin repeat-containing periplasmic protein [Campylobacter sputorum subsp. bubulus]SUX10260.1 ankyrin repeat-containing periplasmic protein [Campylobacter sp